MGMGLSGTGLRGPWPTHVGKPKWAQQPHGHLNPQQLTATPHTPQCSQLLQEPSCSQAAGGI